MANPDFISNGTEQASTGAITVNMPPSWGPGNMFVLYVATDGFTPSLSTPNGFVLAQDPAGNLASVNQALGTCGMHVFWKLAIGSSSATDPAPVLAAPSGGGTVQCCHINLYSNCRASNPFHKIATATVGSATTTINPPSITTTLAGCTVFSLAASAENDSAFNAWTFTGAASPPGGIDSGWNTSLGNRCSWTGGRGGFATAGGPHNGTTTFATSTVQAQITFALASLAEVSHPDDSDAAPLPLAQRVPATPALLPWPVAAAAAAGDDLPGVTDVGIDADDPGPSSMPGGMSSAWSAPGAASAWAGAAGGAGGDDLPGVDAAIVDTDDPIAAAIPRLPGAWTAWLGAAAALGLGDELVPAVSTGGRIGGAGDQQRSFGASPQSGTLSTGAVPLWAASTAYVVDPTAGGINRVQNGGNLYQCLAPGTSASSGGPTGTSGNITDGSVHWAYVGPVAGTDTAAGSQIVAAVMRGQQSLTPGGAIDPTDNDGGTFTLVTNNAYASFPDSFAGVWRRSTGSNAKSGYVLSAQFGGSAGAGDELSLAWIELSGVTLGAPHAFSQVERASPTSGSVTAASITTTKRCLIVSFWFGNGTVQAAGQPDTAAPAGGLVLIANASAPLSLTANGYIQHMVAWRVANPGTFAEVWTSTTNEGAQLVTLAFEDLSAIAVDDSVRIGTTPPVVVWLARPPVTADDDAPITVTTLDDDPPPTAGTWAPGRPGGGSSGGLIGGTGDTGGDDLPIAAVDATLDDAPAAVWTVAQQTSGWGAVLRGVAPGVAPGVADDELPAPALLEDTGWSLTAAWTVPTIQPAQLPDPDDLPIEGAPGAIVDDDPWALLPPWPLAWVARSGPPIDELAGPAAPDTGPAPGHVRIPGITPDPEVYDGAVNGPEIYDGAIREVEIL